MLKWISKLFASIFGKMPEEVPTVPESSPPPIEVSEETDPSMKYLIVGLGNIGAEYMYTRHNVGFEVLDHLAAKHKATWKTETLGDVARIKHRGRTYVMLKPSTFMNRSGKATRYWLEKEKLDKERLLVVVDDLALDFGVLRLRGKGSPGTHNGLKDIDEMTGGGNYTRLRFGIGADFPKGRQVDFVLGRWSDEESSNLPPVLAKAGEACLAFGAIGLSQTMNKYNG